MTQLSTVMSPVFPPEKDADVAANAAPLKHSAHIQLFIRLVEPVVFFQGFETQHTGDRLPAVLRGSLVVRILKPTKLKSISLAFKGYSRTEWPEGIPPKKQEFVEINDIVNHTWPFYDATDPIDKEPRSDSEFDHLLRGSGASMYKPLGSGNGSSATNLAAGASASKIPGMTSPLQLSPVSSNTNINQSLGHALSTTPKKETSTGNLRRSRANSSGSLSASKNSASVRSLSPLNLFRRVTSTNHETARTPRTNDTVNGSPSSSRPVSRVASSTSNSEAMKPVTSTSIFSELLSSTFSSGEPAPSQGRAHAHDTNGHATHSSSSESFTFQPGDYIYTFEQIVPQSYPETIKADFGFVEYFLLATIERYGAFKSNMNARLPVTIVRTQSDTSVEESEPILISRDWENQLFYDIVISSKDIILDAFLPIHFSFSPLDKITLHRVRIYITETMEYYCRGKKIHRLEPTKKFLLAEHCGPALPNAPKDSNGVKAKYMGNLLEDEDGFLSNKSFEFQVFIPSRFGSHQRLHPDTGFDKIKSNHWIKLCLRLSRMIDGKRKHYEISIDSPMHVLHKLCSHANTLLPSYNFHSLAASGITFPSAASISLAAPSLHSRIDNDSVAESAKTNTSRNSDEMSSMYHTSNIFFPKEVFSSPLLSPNVQPIDVSSMNGPARTPLPRITPNRVPSSTNTHRYPVTLPHNPHARHSSGNSTATNDSNKKDIFASPKLKANIYQPEQIERALTSPQAVPLSPITSPLIRPVSFALNDTDVLSINSDTADDPPPEFNFDNNTPVVSRPASALHMRDSRRNSNLPTAQPPSYGEALIGRVGDKGSSSNLVNSRLSKLSLNKSQDSLAFSMNHRRSNVNLDDELENSMTTTEDDGDIASNFSFGEASNHTQNLPANILRSHSPSNIRPMSTDFMFGGGRTDGNNMLPSTLRTDNHFYNDMNQIFNDDASPSEHPTSPIHESATDTLDASPRTSINSSAELSPHSSIGRASTGLPTRDTIGSEPLLNNGLRSSISHGHTVGDTTEMSYDASYGQFGDSMLDLQEQPLDSSVDITALYNRNTAGWNTLQFDEGIDNTHDSRNRSHSNGGTDSSSRLSELAAHSDVKTIDAEENPSYSSVENTRG